MKKAFIIITLFFIAANNLQAQGLKAGFDKQEYIELLHIAASQGDSLKSGPDYLDPPQKYARVYRSAELGLKNRWDLWLSDDQQTMVVSLRGTVNDGASWLENFYCGMIPASGTLQLDDHTTFTYTFARDPKATVHVGWSIGIAYMAPDILQQVLEQYSDRGVKNLYIIGHSQGGALAFLLTSYLRYLQEDGKFPDEIHIKTYCSAAPKPGNLFYAYDFDYLTRGGWAFTVVNAADWVPETPFSLQTLNDFNNLNPFRGIDQVLNKQKPFYVRWYLKRAFGKLDKSTKKSRVNFDKYLGKGLFKQVKKILPQLKEPNYALSMNYMRAGVPIVLQPSSNYYKLYPDTGNNVFIHHGLRAYEYLMKEVY